MPSGTDRLVVVSFDGEHRFLSNFYRCNVSFQGIVYPTVEHAFQSAKTTDRRKRMEVLSISRPGDAKRWGRSFPARPDWEDVKIGVMLACLRSKFNLNSRLRDALLATDEMMLVEGNTWNDRFWGAVWMTGEMEGYQTWAWNRNVSLVGHNWLGLKLMKVRRDLRNV